MKFSIKSNITQYRRRMQNHAKQVDYATSRAINDVTGEARKAIIKKIKGRQKSKRAWWNNKTYGIRRRFANKRHLVGDIYTSIYWAKLQEEGGIKRPHGKHIVVPDDPFPKARRKAGGLKPVLAQKTVFINQGHIYRRVGGKKSRKVKRLASMVGTARIRRPILSFRSTARRIVRRSFKRQFDKRLAQALKTAR